MEMQERAWNGREDWINPVLPQLAWAIFEETKIVGKDNYYQDDFYSHTRPYFSYQRQMSIDGHLWG